MNRVVYLDYNATAPLRPEALAAMLPVLQSVGNAASPHVLGQQSAALVATARRQLADLLKCSAGELIFTSGATEANNIALHGLMQGRRHLIISAVEHPAVIETAYAIGRQFGGTVTVLPVAPDGTLQPEMLREALERERPAVVSIMAANNETGVLFDLSKITAEAHEHEALVHTDATQLVGRLSVDLSKLQVDALSLSAHKFGGPQGIGALFIRRSQDIPPSPILHGGGQENGWRSGTLNVAGIVGAGAAAAAADAQMVDEARRVAILRDSLEAAILNENPSAWLNGSVEARLPNVSSITFPGTPADAMIASMPNVAVSDGSACSSGTPTPSKVLLAMGRTAEEAECTLRFSLGYASTEEDVEVAVTAVIAAAHRVRGLISAMEVSA